MLKTRSALARLLLAGTLFAAPATWTHAADAGPREAIIVVSGEGETGLAPDMAMISLTVNKMAPTAGQALRENAAAMSQVFEALRKRGIADKDMQTSGLSINPQYHYPDSSSDATPEPPRLVGYQVVNMLSVRLRDVTKVGEVLDQSVELGINESAGIQFLNSDTSKASAAARKAAVTDAMEKARALADAAGVRIGRIVEMSESVSAPMPSVMTRMKLEAAPASTPVAIGENVVRVNVSMTFAIAQ